jgi:ribosomal protein L32
MSYDERADYYVVCPKCGKGVIADEVSDECPHLPVDDTVEDDPDS